MNIIIIILIIIIIIIIIIITTTITTTIIITTTMIISELKNNFHGWRMVCPLTEFFTLTIYTSHPNAFLPC